MYKMDAQRGSHILPILFSREDRKDRALFTERCRKPEREHRKSQQGLPTALRIRNEMRLLLRVAAGTSLESASKHSSQTDMACDQ